MLYTIGDAAKELGIPASTLRYYDKEGLLPHTSRSGSGIRMFTEDDFEWVRFIERLKLSGMPIKEIKSYIDLYEQGDATLPQRRELIVPAARRWSANWSGCRRRSSSSRTSAGTTTRRSNWARRPP